MKKVETIGGLFVQLPLKEYQFYIGFKQLLEKKKVNKIPFFKLNERQQVTAMNLIKFNVLNRDSKYLFINGDETNGKK